MWDVIYQSFRCFVNSEQSYNLLRTAVRWCESPYWINNARAYMCNCARSWERQTVCIVSTVCTGLTTTTSQVLVSSPRAHFITSLTHHTKLTALRLKVIRHVHTYQLRTNGIFHSSRFPVLSLSLSLFLYLCLSCQERCVRVRACPCLCAFPVISTFHSPTQHTHTSGGIYRASVSPGGNVDNDRTRVLYPDPADVVLSLEPRL